MNYTEAKKNVTDSLHKLRNAEAELTEHEVNHDKLLEAFQVSYEALTDARANLKVGNGTQKEVDQAEKQNKKLKADIDQCKQDIDVAGKVVEMLQSKYEEVKAQFTTVSVDYHGQKVQPLFDDLSNALQTANDCLSRLAEARKEIQADGLHPAGYMKGITPETEILLNKKRLHGPVTMDLIRSTTLISD